MAIPYFNAYAQRALAPPEAAFPPVSFLLFYLSPPARACDFLPLSSALDLRPFPFFAPFSSKPNPQFPAFLSSP
jgi:hypothetical protein